MGLTCTALLGLLMVGTRIDWEGEVQLAQQRVQGGGGGAPAATATKEEQSLPGEKQQQPPTPIVAP